ncbi:unnamed protein product, partial [Onchocerca ochengi]|uniref:BZIP domain-containing protein n=1 Tax=Onchocerca ochengi TaxID=42157 RepID=A0A182F044_ONCOC
MPGRRSSKIGYYRTNETVRQRLSIANQTEEERTAANERRRQRMAQMRAERQQNERLRVAERRPQETEDQRRTGLRAQQ